MPSQGNLRPKTLAQNDPVFRWQSTTFGMGPLTPTVGVAAPIAQEALLRIDQLYEIEHEISGRSRYERLAIRCVRSKPLVDDLRQSLNEKRPRMLERVADVEADQLRNQPLAWSGPLSQGWSVRSGK
jgi:hypothetical protein